MKDNFLKTIASFGIDIEPAEKSLQRLAEEIGNLDKQLNKLSNRIGFNDGIRIYDQYGKVIKTVDDTMQVAARNVKTITDVAKEHAMTVEEAAKSYGKLGQKVSQTKGFLDKMLSSTFFAHHLNFWLTSGILYGALDTLSQGIVGVEKGVKGLITVLPQLAENEEELRQAETSLIDITQKYGTSLEETMQVARSVGRMYKDIATVMGLVDQITLMNVIDNVRLEDATRGVEAAMATYGKTLKSTNEVLGFTGSLLDKITNLSHNAFVTGTDLVEILQRSSSAALNAKMSIDELLGLGAAATRATGMGGAEIGNMLKSVLAQLSAPSKKVREDIEAIGVKLHDTNGQLKDAYTLILELALATENAKLSQEDLNDAILSASRGVFQYSKLAALVGSFDEIVKNTALSLNAQGQTMKMAAQQLDTIERHVGQLKNTLIDLFSKAGDDGLRNTIKSTIDHLDQFLIGLKNVSSETIKFGAIVMGLGIALKVINGIFIKITTTIETVKTLKEGLTAATTLLAAAETAEGVAATGAATATNLFTAALSKNAPGLLFTVAVTALSAAMIKYTFNAGRAEKATLDLQQAMMDANQTALAKIRHDQDTVQFLETMAQKHEQLTQRINSGTLSTAEMTSAQKDLKAIEAAVASVVDDEGKAILARDGITAKSIKLIANMIEAKQKEQIVTNQAEIAKTESVINETQNRINAINAEIEALNNLLEARNAAAIIEKAKEVNPEAMEINRGLWFFNPEGPTPNIPLPEEMAAEEAIKEYNEKLKQDMEKQQDELKDQQNHLKNLIEQNRALSSSFTEITHIADPTHGLENKEKPQVKSMVDQIRALIENITALADAQKRVNDETQRAIEDTQTRIAYYQRENATVNDLLQAMREQANLIPLMIQKQAGIHEEADRVRLAIAALEARQKSLNTSTEDGKNAYKELTQEIDQLRDRVHQLGVEWWNLQKSMAEMTLSDLEYVRAVRKQNIEALQNEIDYLKENAASQEDLARIYSLSKDLLSILVQKHQEMINKINEQQSYINSLKEAQNGINTSTEEGRRIYDMYSKAIADAGETLNSYKKELLDVQKSQMSVYQDMYNNYSSYIDHLANLGLLTTQQQLAYLSQIDKTKLSLQAQWQLEEKLYDLRRKMLEEQRDAEIEHINQLKDAYQKASDARIQAIQDEIDALDRELELQREQKQLEEKQKALQEAQQKLANVQSERNVRIFNQGRWEYIADPQAVREAQKEVEEAQKDLNDTLEEISQNARKRALQEQLDYEREQQRIQLESYDRQIKEREDYWKKQIELTNQNWVSLLGIETANWQAYDQLVQQQLSQALASWEAYYSRVQQIMLETGGMIGAEPNTAGLPGYASGGAITADQIAKLHRGEYVLNAESVSLLGGFAGVERLVADLKTPEWRRPAVSSVSNTTQVNNSVNRSINIGTISLPNVYDVSGFLRNLRQLVK
ncbi:phage tail tape measure protein [Neomoorella humiferrea]|uniref:phage tail tape measure protein n=1 Tax=Neomoorella humiferrea TaxID=676965 RepID=UPI003D94697B